MQDRQSYPKSIVYHSPLAFRSLADFAMTERPNRKELGETRPHQELL